MENNVSRRSFFKFGLMGIAALPIVGKISSAKAEACPAKEPAGKQIQKEGEGMGKMQKFVADATKSKEPTYKAGQNCANCKFYNKAKAEGGYAPCAMMANKYVTSCGWCKAYKAV